MPAYIALLLALCAASVALAEETTGPGDSLSEVVVTAQKRTERLQDVPITITALSEFYTPRELGVTLDYSF